MCKAIQEMQMEAEQRGKREGEQIGRREGESICRLSDQPKPFLYFFHRVTNHLCNFFCCHPHFISSLREVLLFIKYSKDKEALSRVLERDKKRFGELERRAVDVIQAVTNSGIKSPKAA